MKRWLVKLVVFLLLGAIVNVAVAWGCGWRSDFNRSILTETYAPQEYSDEMWVFSSMARRIRGFGIDRVECSEGFVLGKKSNTGAAHTAGSGFGLAPWIPSSLVSSWGTGTWPDETRVYLAQGWPCLAMWCQLSYSRMIEGGILLSVIRVEGSQYGWGFWLIDVEHVLAFRPLWPGFAVNTIFYATIL